LLYIGILYLEAVPPINQQEVEQRRNLWDSLPSPNFHVHFKLGSNSLEIWRFFIWALWLPVKRLVPILLGNKWPYYWLAILDAAEKQISALVGKQLAQRCWSILSAVQTAEGWSGELLESQLLIMCTACILSIQPSSTLLQLPRLKPKAIMFVITK
jgi:hypothetical protein